MHLQLSITRSVDLQAVPLYPPAHPRLHLQSLEDENRLHHHLQALLFSVSSVFLHWPFNPAHAALAFSLDDTQ